MDKKIIFINDKELEKVSGGNWAKNLAIVSIGSSIAAVIFSTAFHMPEIIDVAKKAVDK